MLPMFQRPRPTQSSGIFSPQILWRERFHPELTPAQAVCSPHPVHAEHSHGTQAEQSSFQRRKRGQSKRAASVLPWLAPPHFTSRHTTAPMMQPRDNKRARLLPNAALVTLDDDLMIRSASYLDADGLVQLGRTCARFGIPQAGQRRSLVNGAAHQLFRQSATDEERKCLPKYVDESDVGLCRALEQLRQPLRFDELVGNGFGRQEHPARVTCKEDRHGWSTAMSGHVMRGGRHFVEFVFANAEQGSLNIFAGVIRPVSLANDMDVEADWKGDVHPIDVSSRFQPAVADKVRSQRTAEWGGSNVNCCAYDCLTGECFWTDWNNEKDSPEWQGQEVLEGSGTAGLLLDLNEGTLSVFMNDRRLGVMKDGLGDEYCWFVSVWEVCMVSMSKGRAPNY